MKKFGDSFLKIHLEKDHSLNVFKLFYYSIESQFYQNPFVIEQNFTIRILPSLIRDCDMY